MQPVLTSLSANKVVCHSRWGIRRISCGWRIILGHGLNFFKASQPTDAKTQLTYDITDNDQAYPTQLALLHVDIATDKRVLTVFKY